MYDVTKLSDIRSGMVIRIRADTKQEIEGIVSEVYSNEDDPEGILVLLESGDFGHVVNVINSPKIIKDRIMSETQNSENKPDFYDPIMRIDVIPKTIQSFLNSSGGYLYIGVDDDAPQDKKIIGLGNDFEIIRNKHQLPDQVLSAEKIQDYLVSAIETTLDKFLKSDSHLGPFLDFDFPEIDNKTILEVNIKRSPTPVFYKYLTAKNKEMQFKIHDDRDKYLSDRQLDDFYYRDGSRKIPLDTFEKYQQYYNQHFQNS